MAKTMGMGELPPRFDEDADDIDVEVPMDEAVTNVEPKYVENEDGSVDVDLDDTYEERNSKEFDENLAEDLLNEFQLQQLGLDYSELAEEDIKAREGRDKQYEEGIRRTGMGNDAPGGAEFQGATRVVHPMLAKGCIDFASRAIKELFPSTGPCKTQIIGEQTEEKLDRAERKKTFMNWQSTTQIQENRSELEKLLSQVPLGGAQYKRWWYDPELKRNRTEAVFIDNIFTPAGHTDFYTSPRITFRQRILRQEYERRVRTGLYRDLDLVDDSYLALNEESRSQTATDKVEGVDPESAAYNIDGLRLIFEIQVQMKLEEDPLLPEGLSAPYILHIDVSSKKVLGLYRNWKEDDDRYQKKHWMTEWPFIPWRDGPAVGLPHIIGSLSGAATGALRAIIDAAHIQNFPGGLMLEGGKTAGESIQVNATQLQRIKPPAGMTDPDIRKLVMGFPFNGPSAVLYNTLEWLTQQAESVVATASEKIADAKGDMPVGTALALIEHGSANFSAIHARLHAAMKMDLAILHRLNAEHLEDEETVEDLGELVVSRKDFEGPMDIIPVSDPNIFSETQRFAQLQAVMQLKADPQFIQFFKPEQLLARALKLLQVPDVEGIANLPKDAKRLNALEENYVASSADNARPLKAYNGQDHLAHLKMHIHYSTSPMMGANPLIAGGIVTKMLQHCKEHLLMLYKEHTEAAIEAMRTVAQMQGLPLSEDNIQLQGAAFADQIMAQILGPMVMPGLQQMQKMADDIAKASKPQASPEVQLVEATKKELKGMELQATAAENEKDRQSEAQAAQLATEAELRDQANQRELANLATNVQLIITQQNNASKQLLAEFSAAKSLQASVVEAVLTAALAEIQTAVQAGQEEIKSAVAAQPNANDLAEQLLTPLLPMVQSAMQNGLAGMSNGDVLNSVTSLAMQYQNLEQILQSERQSNGQAIATLAQSVMSLQQQLNTPREAEIYVGPDGKKRARQVMRPPQQLPAPGQQPQPGPMGQPQ